MVPVIDSHCHLDFDDFAKDLPAVLERARQAGLVAMICVGSGADLATAIWPLQAFVSRKVASAAWTAGVTWASRSASDGRTGTKYIASQSASSRVVEQRSLYSAHIAPRRSSAATAIPRLASCPATRPARR